MEAWSMCAVDALSIPDMLGGNAVEVHRFQLRHALRTKTVFSRHPEQVDDTNPLERVQPVQLARTGEQPKASV
ncbi:hypothetical protein [Streptomyces sp. NPDC101149]|uniref:hypothetical protein n=1 Tax=Streptomyces sp. NPDC101149 TaxID=3366113 RepID=UPI00381D4488